MLESRPMDIEVGLDETVRISVITANKCLREPPIEKVGSSCFCFNFKRSGQGYESGHNFIEYYDFDSVTPMGGG